MFTYSYKNSLKFSLFISLFILSWDSLDTKEKGITDGLSSIQVPVLRISERQASQKDLIKTPNKLNKRKEKSKKKDEREQVKKLMAVYNRKAKKAMEKYTKELEKDEKLKKVLKETELAKAKHQEENRKAMPSIPQINAKHLDELYQGDIMLSLEQAQFLVTSITAELNDSETENRALRVKRGAIINPIKYIKWPLRVPYSFDDTITIEMKSMINSGIKLWSSKTCLNIVEDVMATPRIQFTNAKGTGCWSYVGIRPYTYQEIHLEYPKCYQIGIVVHEIGHALGLIHEHCRHDRDEFIWVLTENTKSEQVHNFATETKETIGDYQIPYDLGSIMHYGPKIYSLNDGYTMLTKAGFSYINTIGQNYGPSISDYMVMNKHYCGLEFFPDGSSRNTVSCGEPTVCHNNGFQNPQICKECICPLGYIGKKCEKIDIVGYAPVGIENKCNGELLRAESNWKYLQGEIGTPNLESKFEYAYCHWQIIADIGKTIHIEILEIGGECYDGCSKGNTEIRTAENRGETGIRLCCSSGLRPNGILEITATNGYAMISLLIFENATLSYSIQAKQNFFLFLF